MRKKLAYILSILFISSIVVYFFPKIRAFAVSTCSGEVQFWPQNGRDWSSQPYGIRKVYGKRVTATVGSSGCGTAAIAMIITYWTG
jgi:hypothetical protein